MSVDNNGTILALSAPPSAGAASLTGTLYFGIGTQTNNGLGSATVLSVTSSADTRGGGLFTAVYNGQSLVDSFIDSGSSSYLFSDSSIPLCTVQAYSGFYCPASAITLNPTLQGLNGAEATPALALNNAQALLSSRYTALPGLGASAEGLDLANAIPTSFDFGLPFFFGRSIYTAIEGRAAGSGVGPYYAF